MKKVFIFVLSSIIIISLSLGACALPDAPYKITEDDLANLEYKIDITPGGTAKLEDGSYSEEAAPGSASKIEVMLTENITYGDLTSNGIEDAAVILWATGGGSGSFYYLSAVINDEEGPGSTNSLFLGDRIEISDISIDSGLITVEFLDRTLEQSFAEEPTVEMTRLFKVQDGNLVLVSETTFLGEYSVSISLKTTGLPYSWQSYLVESTPYEEDIPLGPMGLPKHLQIRFIAVDTQETPSNNPIIYVIPVEGYKKLWEDNGDDSVRLELDAIDGILQNRPDPFPSGNVPVLPFEEVAGDNDISVQGKYMEFDRWEGYRFVGRFSLAFDPVTSEGMSYIFQGFAGKNDDYLVSFFFPATNQKLPDGEDVTPEEYEKMADDPESYYKDIITMLNGFDESDWDPDLAILDDIISSLDIEILIAEEPVEDEKENIVSRKGMIDRISGDSLELDDNGAVILIYLDGYKLPRELSVGDRVYVKYMVDRIAEQNILKYIEILEDFGPSEPPAIELEIYSGPTYVPHDGICYYRVKATATGTPSPYITWSRDDAEGSLGSEKAQINLYDVDEKYTLTTTAKNSAGSASASVELRWGCNKPPVIEEIVTVKEHFTNRTYPVSVTASDPDGDKLTYSWSVTGGTMDDPKSNQLNWTTPSTAGFYDIKVTVDDGKGGKTTKTIRVEVKKPDEPPPEPEPPELTGTAWEWESFTSGDDSVLTVTDPAKYTLLLDPDGTLKIVADCNTGNGTYTKQGSSLTLELDTITRAICGPDSLSDDYIAYIGDVASYVIENGKLYLNLEADTGNMVFRLSG